MLLKILKATLLLLLVVACVREKEVIIGNGTNLVINIQDEWDAPLNAEVNVFLFESETDYTEALKDTDPSKARYQTTSNPNGVATFENITSGIKYFIYIDYYGKAYRLNNYYDQKQLESPLLADAITTVTLSLTPFDVGAIAFWTDQKNLSGQGLEVFIGDSLIGNIDSVRNTPPTSIEDTQILPVFYQTAGSYKIQVKASNGCYWSLERDLKENEFLPVKLENCEFGSVTFWGEPNIFETYGELNFSINEEANNGKLSNGRGNAPSNCNFAAIDYLTIGRPVGQYNYKITSSKSDCVWIGNFTVVEGCGEKIEINKCQ